MEKLRCSPSSLGSDEDDCGIYAESYFSSTWVYIGDNEELQVWQRPNSTGGFYIDIKQFCCLSCGGMKAWHLQKATQLSYTDHLFLANGVEML